MESRELCKGINLDRIQKHSRRNGDKDKGCLESPCGITSFSLW